MASELLLTADTRTQVDVPPAISCQDGELRVSPRPECGGCSLTPPRWDLRSAAGAEPRISEETDTCPCWVLVPADNHSGAMGLMQAVISLFISNIPAPHHCTEYRVYMSHKQQLCFRL